MPFELISSVAVQRNDQAGTNRQKFVAETSDAAQSPGAHWYAGEPTLSPRLWYGVAIVLVVDALD